MLDFFYQVALDGTKREMRELMNLSWCPLSVMACALLPLAISGCASSSYMGIALNSGSADPELKQLVQLARVGDKQAQFELGTRFEVGDGVPQDKTRAMRLYRIASKDSGGATWSFMPSPGNRAPAMVVPVANGPVQAGLAEAQQRLDKLARSCRVPQNIDERENRIDERLFSVSPFLVLQAATDIGVSKGAYIRRLEDMLGHRECSAAADAPTDRFVRCDLGDSARTPLSATLIFEFHEKARCNDRSQISDCAFEIHLTFNADYVLSDTPPNNRCASREKVSGLLKNDLWILNGRRTDTISIGGHEGVGIFSPGIRAVEHSDFYGLKSSAQSFYKSQPRNFLTRAIISYSALTDCAVSFF